MRRGTIGELRAMADLLERGFFVYWAVRADAPFDLVAYCRGTHRHWAVEVRTKARRSCELRGAGRLDHDVLAVVDGLEVRYFRYQSGRRNRRPIADFRAASRGGPQRNATKRRARRLP